MTTLLTLMGFLVLAIAGLGVGLWQMVRLSRHGRCAAPAELAQVAPLRSYGPMARLFDGRDLQFLQSQRGCRPGMATRLRLERRAVLSLYLRQAHADFRQCWASCRTMAHFSESPEFAPAAVKQVLAFYGLYTALQVHCLLGLLVYVRPDVGGLLAVLQRLQQRARQTVGERPTGLPAATAR
jgi:hypothetical protein